MGRFFTVEKKIEVAASKQHAAKFVQGDVIADWQPIQIPKGSCILRALTFIVRPKGDAAPTPNSFPYDIVFSKTNTVSLGTVNSSIDHRPSNDFIGIVEIDANQWATSAWTSTAIASLGTDTSASTLPLVLTGDPTSGDNVGFDTVYVGIVSRDNDVDFISINAVNETSFAAGAQTVITMDGTSMDVREHFAAGDILHAQDDAVLGTLASADTATQLTLTAANTDAIAEDDIIYNLHPIKLVLGLER